MENKVIFTILLLSTHAMFCIESKPSSSKNLSPCPCIIRSKKFINSAGLFRILRESIISGTEEEKRSFNYDCDEAIGKATMQGEQDLADELKGLKFEIENK
jgi:hypothetical protein